MIFLNKNTLLDCLAVLFILSSVIRRVFLIKEITISAGLCECLAEQCLLKGSADASTNQ